MRPFTAADLCPGDMYRFSGMGAGARALCLWVIPGASFPADGFGERPGRRMIIGLEVGYLLGGELSVAIYQPHHDLVLWRSGLKERS